MLLPLLLLPLLLPPLRHIGAWLIFASCVRFVFSPSHFVTPAGRVRSTPYSSPLLSPARAPLAPPYFDAAAAPDSPMLQAGRVASIASEYMLMEYAAELKGLTQMSLKRGVRAAQNLPREISDAAVRIREHAVRIVAALKAELVELTTARANRAQASQKRRIRNAHTHLQAAAELLSQTEQRTAATAAKHNSNTQQNQQTVAAADENVPLAPPMERVSAAGRLGKALLRCGGSSSSSSCREKCEKVDS